ncbi:YutD-like domain-containing protein [Streptococcus sp. sy018]|uniref:YutD family protein n=1 Tax=Streptococcus sp. sy018 TaxID=2600147 RepID=UPI0011B58A50|nr:YutD-like domain-containing protein [Streptococcus sp. sy018]TWS95291.1 DUF1027 domain-containing protein [Streptococcus sp. sy018]
MKKEIAPELYNYNKFPGPEFICLEQLVKSDDLTFDLVDNYRDAFDAQVFSQRFSPILLKYDYIVGDWGNDQLRLKGFYRPEKALNHLDNMNHLEDYLKEFCNYGCAYFVLYNHQPQEAIEEPVFISQRPRKKSYRSRTRNKIGKKDNKSSNKEQYEERKQNFVIRQKKG